MSEGVCTPIAVIGANGFVGRRVVRMLAETAGFRPIAAMRRAPPNGRGIETRTYQASDAASIAAALEGCASVINCVAGTGETMLSVTRNICSAAGTKRIVHLSSMAVYGSATGLIEESHELAGVGWYGRAKVVSEALIEAHVAAGGNAVILRPGCIHGPGSDQWTGRIARLLRQNRLGDLGVGGDGVCNLIAVDDVAAAALVAMTKADINGEAFNLSDPEPGTWNQYFLALARAIGATPLRRISDRWPKIEKRVAIPIRVAEKARLGAWLPDAIPGALLALFQQDIQLDHRKTDARLGFVRTKPSDAIAAAAAWANARA